MSENREEIPFWLVWSPAGRAPVFRHASRQTAEIEARRLADLSPGSSFFVLAPVTEIVRNDITVKRFSDGDGIPF
jgi:hypothetical protein